MGKNGKSLPSEHFKRTSPSSFFSKRGIGKSKLIYFQNNLFVFVHLLDQSKIILIYKTKNPLNCVFYISQDNL